MCRRAQFRCRISGHLVSLCRTTQTGSISFVPFSIWLILTSKQNSPTHAEYILYHKNRSRASFCELCLNHSFSLRKNWNLYEAGEKSYPAHKLSRGHYPQTDLYLFAHSPLAVSVPPSRTPGVTQSLINSSVLSCCLKLSPSLSLRLVLFLFSLSTPLHLLAGPHSCFHPDSPLMQPLIPAVLSLLPFQLPLWLALSFSGLP